MEDYKIDEKTGLYPYSKLYNVTEKGDLILIGHKYVDPFDPNGFLICKDPDYFMRFYGLTKAQVWNICHGYDKDYIPKCFCGNELQFINFKFGYQTTCSRSCSATKTLIENWKDNDYRENILSQLHSNETVANRNRTEFLNLGDKSDKCYFYLAWSNYYPNYLKFGVSFLDPYYKKRREGYKSIHKLFNMERVNIAEFEYELAIKFGSEWIEYDKIEKFFIELKSSIKSWNSYLIP